MRYGLIGEKLGHSFSKEIHEGFGKYEYELIEIAPDKLDSFFAKKDFTGINVTIPYTETVIRYLDEISDEAKKIGAVNTIVNDEGTLIGYNTDIDGLKYLIKKNDINFDGKTVLIAGSGGSSKTAEYVAKDLGAKNVVRMSRSGRAGAATYEDALRDYSDAEIFINTTPVGMQGFLEGEVIDIDLLPDLEAVIDLIYNPNPTKLVERALCKGIKAVGGMEMLIEQAGCSSKYFLRLIK